MSHVLSVFWYSAKQKGCGIRPGGARSKTHCKPLKIRRASGGGFSSPFVGRRPIATGFHPAGRFLIGLREIGRRVERPIENRREIQVLEHVASGNRNREIGQRLFISEDTVKRHMKNIMQKLGAN